MEGSPEAMVEARPQPEDQIDDANVHELTDDKDQTVPEKSQKRTRFASSIGPLAVFLGTALCTGILAYRRLTKGRRSKTALRRRLFCEINVSALQNNSTLPNNVKRDGLLPLHGISFVVSDRFDIFGFQTRFGCDEWQSQNPICEKSAPLVESLVSLGGNLLAAVPAVPLGIKGQTVGSNSDDGALVSVSSHLADASLTVDEAGSVMIGAAYHGLYSYRPTANACSLDGISNRSATLSVPSIVARDPNTLCTVASALRMGPLSGSNATTVSNYLIAEDLFSVCGEQVKRATPIVIEAVKRWAGMDNAQALSLCDWLYHRMPLLRKFMDEKVDDKESVSQSNEQPNRCRQVLRALASVSRVIKNWEWVNTSPSGQWIAQSGLQHLKPDALQEWNAAVNGTTKEQYEVALSVMDELSSGIRAALQDGYVFVMPTIPSTRSDVYSQAEEEFCVLAALAGVPLVTIPFRRFLSISLLSLQRQDYTLLKAATRLGPMLEELSNDEQHSSLRSRPTSGGVSGAVNGNSPGSRGNQSLNGHVSEADAAKEAGNAAFKAGKYEEAVTWYSEAIKKDPNVAVYYSNRAMALLKCGRYGAAESDCDAAIKLNPAMVKAYLRRGSSRLALGNLIEAKDDFERVLVLEPQNRQATEELKRLEKAVGNVVEDTALFTGRQ